MCAREKAKLERRLHVLRSCIELSYMPFIERGTSNIVMVFLVILAPKCYSFGNRPAEALRTTGSPDEEQAC
jgi:hypothetical protein